ncbi:MAG: sulfotransferase domain-containing protein [Nitrospirota bacterium]|nr:sulfotransferase domain-containing protein [Nitrospirota bacterium]
MAMFRSLLSPLKRPIRRALDSKLQEQIVSRTGLTPMGQYETNDVFVAGYPKSGNTWFQNLLAGIVYGLDSDALPDTLIQDLVPDIHNRRYYRRYATPMYFKTHELPHAEHKRVIYLLRDGRDVMVSYFHYLKALNPNGADFAEIVRTGRELSPCKWHEHVAAWESNPFQAEMITVRYEDLLDEPLGQLRHACEFIGVTRSDSQLQTVIEKSSFTKMRRKEEQLGWEDRAWPKDKFFVRRGVVGSYKDEMPPEVLALFLADAEVTLRTYNYSV